MAMKFGDKKTTMLVYCRAGRVEFKTKFYEM